MRCEVSFAAGSLARTAAASGGDPRARAPPPHAAAERPGTGPGMVFASPWRRAMLLDPFVESALRAGASDLHLEPGLAPALRVQGQLRAAGEPVSADTLLAAARELLPAERWAEFQERRSADLGRSIRGVRCRINAL